MRTIPRDVQNAVFADIVAQITHQPKTGHFPRIEASLRKDPDSLFFVRVGPDLVLKVPAQSAAEALEIARSKSH